MSEPASLFLRSFAEAWEPLVNRRGSAPDFVATFSAACRHYTAVAPAIRARVVVLNDAVLVGALFQCVRLGGGRSGPRCSGLAQWRVGRQPVAR